jgi:NhaA family Na+:H+ antiporter
MMAIKSSARLDRLPKESVHWLTAPFRRFLRIEAAAGGVLLACTGIALVLSNSPWSHSYMEFWELPLGLRIGTFDYARTLKEWINDGLMTLFFLLVAVELKRELAMGELRSPRLAALSIAAALGGMLVPAGLFILMQFGQPDAAGWGTVMATDTAFVIGCLALLGARVPHTLRLFMLSLAIVDDIGAIFIVAIGYSKTIDWHALSLAVLGIAALRLMTVVGIRSIVAYCTAGSLVWLAFDASGIHATITGVLLGLLTPTHRWVSDKRLYAILGRVIANPTSSENSGKTQDRETLQAAETAARETLSPAERIQIALHPWVGFFVMPVFALANAGLPLHSSDLGDSLTLAIFIGFALGKPIGVLAFTWLAVRFKIAQCPLDLHWGLITGGSLLAGIGFTMALFIANLAFDASQINPAKLGILFASTLSAIGGLAVLTWVTRHPRPLL